jgi:hypothetical protein
MKAIHTKVLPTSAHYGTRIKVMCEGFKPVTVTYDGFGETAHRNAVTEFLKKHKLNWDSTALVSGYLKDGSWVFVDCEAEKKKSDQIEKCLRDLVEYITSGDHYETKNPYTRQPVVNALQVLANWYGGDWLDANKK